MATNQPAPAVVLTTGTAPADGGINKKHQGKLKGLAITELIFGSICVIFGAAICGIAGYGISYSTKQYIYNPHTGDYEYIYVPRILRISVWGEGIWCGVWIIVAGALGVHAAKSLASRCMIITHMTFSIVGSVFSGVMFAMGVFGARNGYFVDQIANVEHLLVLYCLLCVFSFVSMVLLILSSSYCCAALKCCGPEGQGCCNGYGQSYGQHNVYPVQSAVYTQQTAMGGQAGVLGHQVVYAQQAPMGGQQVTYAQQAIPFQAGVTPQGYAMPGVQPMMQPGFPGYVQPNQVVVNPSVQNPDIAEKVQEAAKEPTHHNALPSNQTP